MANESFSVDTDGLHLQLPYVQQLAARFKGIAGGLEGRLSDLGPCWGDDATGEEFFKQYDAPHQEIHKGIGGIGQVVHSTAEGIRTMAVNFERLEDNNIESVRRINTGAGEHRPAPERPVHG
ncbi:WXG100 family type VII secretion target [Kitasatospora sp. NPDC059722]|uniref:WXG100 family type VII secretion target n=1 Tax=unclassified Kitasatospora TaxID=2633591 RepID=UPI003650DBCE